MSVPFRISNEVCMLFASPDFGAGGMVCMVILAIGVAIFGVSIAIITSGLVLQRRNRVWTGLLLILVGVALPVGCCSAPSVLFRMKHETPPLVSLPDRTALEGMTFDEIRDRLGVPHHVDDRDPERISWLYYRDTFELGWFMVIFGPDGKVTRTACD